MNIMPSNKIQGIQYWHQIVLLMCLGWVVIWIFRPVLTAIYPEVQTTIGPQSDAALGLIASCYFLGYASMQIPLGLLADKFGRKVVLIPCFILFIIAVLIIGNANSIKMIYLGSLLAGVGCASYYGVAYSLSIQNIPAENLGFATAIINTGTALGMGVSLLATNFLVKKLEMPWYYMLYVIAVLLAGMTIAFALIIRNYAEANATIKPVKIGTVVNENQTKKHSIARFFTVKMVAAYLIYFATLYGYYMIVSWLPSFLEAERGFTKSSGLISSLVAFSAIPGALTISFIANKLRHRRVAFIIGLQIISVITLFMIVQAGTTAMLFMGLIFYGLLGKVTVEPIIISYFAENAPSNAYGTAFAALNFFGMISAIIGPAFAGFLTDITGTKVTGFYVAIGVLIVATILFFLINIIRSEA